MMVLFHSKYKKYELYSTQNEKKISLYEFQLTVFNK